MQQVRVAFLLRDEADEERTKMRYILASAIVAGTLATAGIATVSTAEARQSTKSFSCNGLRALIDRRGAVVLNTTSRYVYNSIVRNFQMCPTRTFAVKNSVPTTTGSCRVTYCDNVRPSFGFAREGTGGNQGFR